MQAWSRPYIRSFDLIYVQAWSRPYIRSFDLIYVQVDLIYLTSDLIYQILTIYLKTDFCPIWRVILGPLVSIYGVLGLLGYLDHYIAIASFLSLVVGFPFYLLLSQKLEFSLPD